MSKKITTEIFIQKANAVHGLCYDYSKSLYVESHDKIEIICPFHGSFFQAPNNHLNGMGCPTCANEKRKSSARLTTEDFIKRSKKIHKNKYSYEMSVYNGWENEVKLRCPKHGSFNIVAGDHLKGRGCKKCRREHQSEIQKKPLDDFIIQANKAHNNRYNYSQTVYKNNRSKITVICSQHGAFFVNPDNHLKGYGGCPKCGKEKEYAESLKKFIEKAKKVHANFYDYSEAEFNGYKIKIKIICPKHGSFYQQMDSHLRGTGCLKCILKEESKLERILKETFESWKIERHKKIFSEEHGRFRKFDFFLSKDIKKVIIEYDGLQHLKPVRFSNKMSQEKADKKFEEQKKTDSMDTAFCDREKIGLYRISCKENMAESAKNIFKKINYSPFL